MTYSFDLLSVFPKWHVIHARTLRTAQFTARLLAERFPGTTFGYGQSPDVRHCDCHPSIRDSALSVEVQQLVAPEIAFEAAADPEGLPK